MARPPEGDWIGTPYLRFERMGSHAVLTVDRPEARNALTGATYFGIRYAIDRVTMDASVFGPEARDGWEAFRDKRSPDWVPEDLRTGRL